METLLSISVGIGLSAACGFRVFVPLLIMSIASHAGHLTLSPGFEWIGTTPALVAFAVATCLEIGGFYVPWVDNLLDAIATPAAIVAGIIVMASAVSGMTPLLKWALAVIAGGGVAGTVQVGTGIVRGTSTVTTAGFGNPLVATMELGGALTLSLVAVTWPVLAGGAAVLVALGFVGRKLLEKRTRHSHRVPASGESLG